MNLMTYVKGRSMPYNIGYMHGGRTLIKYLVAMKIFLLVLFLSLNVSAKVYSQKVNLKVTQSPLRKVLTEIRKQTNYYFLYTTDVLKDAKPVSLNLKNVALDDALKIIFKDQPIQYKLEENKVVVLSVIEPSKTKPLIKPITIRGRVTDEKGVPLPGATIKASGKEVVTDSKGEFILAGVDEDAKVEVSYIGYNLFSLTATAEFMSIALQQSSISLTEVPINKGYYTTSKILNTGAVSTVSAREIEQQPVGDPLMALHGRAAGLIVTQTTGVSGSRVNVQLRGVNSLRSTAGANQPFFIVDGIPFNPLSLSQNTDAAQGLSPFSSIRPDDIASIEILKDADATAIYGSRGANGVILITTKRGGVGKTTFDANVYTGAGKISHFIDLMNTEEYLALRKEGLKNDNTTPAVYDHDLNGNWKQGKYTDWQKVLIGGTAKVTDGKVSVSGGTAQSQYLISGAYRRETTVYPGDYANETGSAHFSLNNVSIDSKFKSSLTGSYAFNKNVLPFSDFTGSIFTAPNAPDIYNNIGQLNWENSTFGNPLAGIKNKSSNTTRNLIANTNLSYEIFSGLTMKGTFGYNYIQLDESQIRTFASVDPAQNDPSSSRTNGFGSNQLTSWIAEPQLSYSKRITKHSIDALVGATFQQQSNYALRNLVSGFPSDKLITNISGATNKGAPAASRNEYKYNAFFARLGYNYDEKYVLNLTARRDGSSRFGPGKQFGNFGAIGAAWIFSKEKWLSDISNLLSLGKLRGSIGTTGNDRLTDYEFLSTYSSTLTYLNVATLSPVRLANPDYRWETIKKIEVGAELGLLNDKFNLTVDWYRNRTGNQLVSYALPSSTGFTTITQNLPAVIENTGWEFVLNSSNLKKEDFEWSTNANITIARNKLVSYPNFEGSSYFSRYMIGQPVTIRKFVKLNGVDLNTGLYQFDDKNGDGSISLSGDGLPVDLNPKYYGGLNNHVSYKSFTLDFFLQFVKQKGFDHSSLGSPGLFFEQNQPRYLSDRWKAEGDIAKYQRSVGDAFGEAAALQELFNISDGIITDASFIRLKNVSLSWNLPAKWNYRNTVKNLRLYLQCQNVFTITGYRGFDPETTSPNYVALPTLRMLTAGINLTL